MKTRLFPFKNFFITLLLSLIITNFNFLSPSISFVMAYLLYLIIYSNHKLLSILLIGFLFDGFLGFQFGLINFIFLLTLFSFQLLKKIISIKEQQETVYNLSFLGTTIIMFQSIYLKDELLIPYFLFNLICSVIFFIYLKKYGN
jgi:hypothetical protein